MLIATLALSCASPGAPRVEATEAPPRAVAPAPRVETIDSPPRAVTPVSNASVVLREGGCTITVGAIERFEVFRGGYRSEDWIARLPPDQRAEAQGEDHLEVHGQCVLEVHIDDSARRYLHVVRGFVTEAPGPSREQCLADRVDVARRLMTMTEHCADPDGRGALTQTLLP